MIFTASQVAAIKTGKQSATLVPVSEHVRAGALRVLRRWALPDTYPAPAIRGPAVDVLAFIQARLDLVETVELVINPQSGGEQIPALITVKRVRDLSLSDLSAADARCCGVRTVTVLRAGWAVEHPRSPLVRLVGFELGDTRDMKRLIAWGWPDYTSLAGRAMTGEPEALSRDAQAALSSDAQQRWLALRASAAQELAASSLAERLVAIQAGTVMRTVALEPFTSELPG